MKIILSIAIQAVLAVVVGIGNAEAKGEKCSVTVSDELAPGRTVVVVGCSGSGIAVLDRDLNLLYRWDACSACGGFFGSFAGTKTIKGRKALMVKMADGPRMESGDSAEPTIALHFDGKQFRFADHFGE